MSTRKKKRPFKAVDILGHDIPPHSIDPEILILGDQKTGVTLGQIKKALNGRIDQNTIITINAHGQTLHDDHFMYLEPGKPILTQKIITLIQECAPESALQIDIASCYSGSANKEITLLNHGSTLTASSAKNREGIFVVDKLRESEVFSQYALEKNPYIRFFNNFPFKAATKSSFTTGGVSFFLEPSYEVLLSRDNALNFLKKEAKRFEVGFKGDKIWKSKSTIFPAIEFSEEKLNIFVGSFFAVECTNNKHFHKFLTKHLGTNQYLQQFVNYSFEQGDTGLYMAAADGHIKNVKALLKAGADPNIPASYNATAIFSATHEEHLSTVKALIKAGADVDAPRDGGLTALGMAVVKENIKIVKALLKAGANPNKISDDGSTILFVAIDRGNSDIVKALLKAGADPHISYKNVSPLKFALGRHENKIADIIKIYIEKAAEQEEDSYNSPSSDIGEASDNEHDIEVTGHHHADIDEL